jgi:hypothetical protein
LLDVNIDLFPVAAGDKLALALASTLREDGSRMPYDIKSREELYDPVRGVESGGAGSCALLTVDECGAELSPQTARSPSPPRNPGTAAPQKLLSGRSLASDYEYAMHGRVYRYGDAVGGGAGHARADVYVSFGGLLMQLSGDPKRLEALDLDAAVYLLARKV